MDNSKEFKGTEKDKCVCCGKDTEYTKYEPINTRYNYVECVGQLCGECYKQVYKGRID